MDNASKAILIAGGILISVAVMSLAIYMFSTASGIVANSEADLKVNEIVSFNRYFQAYDSTIIGADAVSIYNKITSNNTNRDASDQWYVHLDYSNTDLGNWLNQQNESNNYMNKYSYSYSYGDDGIISHVTIGTL